ncbi:hypothetical protein JOY44_17340 [Phormidium sp. CLA17]|uniref:hypothetical protein n=1 Tax=Leptolyngbya sp. Cla-17 TaxID=2803751 RepID=UPI0014920CB2|nr:hypothetical protein [Leptolyngbya sp. Cla-17]MBM0743355.1 hypothetical protein [Leptolyngbya sp. Cla-17]
MALSSLPSDDRAPVQLGKDDKTMHRQLKEALSKGFYEACSGVIQALLLACEWHLTTEAHALTLVIACPDMTIHWRVLSNLAAIGHALERFTPNAKICICPPVGTGIPFELRVDEISLYRDLF